jgi:hypothetical protein
MPALADTVLGMASAGMADLAGMAASAGTVAEAAGMVAEATGKRPVKISSSGTRPEDGPITTTQIPGRGDVAVRLPVAGNPAPANPESSAN